jgi:hypothetical protein
MRQKDLDGAVTLGNNAYQLTVIHNKNGADPVIPHHFQCMLYRIRRANGENGLTLWINALFYGSHRIRQIGEDGGA